MSFAVVLALLVPWPAAAVPPQEVSVCDLTNRAETYHSQLVVVEAYFHLDEWILYDPNCAGRDDWIALDDAPDAETSFVDKIPSDKSGVIEARFVGRFQGPDGYGYSNFGRLRTQLQVLEVTALRWPTDPEPPDYDAPAPRLEAREDIDAVGSRWMAAVESRDIEELQEILAKDYVAVLPNGDRVAGTQTLNALVLPHSTAFKERTDRGLTAETYEMRTRIFVIDADSAVSIRQVSLGGFATTGAEWEYVNFFRRVESRWRLAFSRLRSSNLR